MTSHNFDESYKDFLKQLSKYQQELQREVERSRKMHYLEIGIAAISISGYLIASYVFGWWPWK